MSGGDLSPGLRPVRIDDLVPFDRNPRTISEEGLEKLAASIRTFGFQNPVLAQAGTGLVVAGHQRLKAARMAGLEEVDVLFRELTDEQAAAYNVADNRLAEESDWDRDALADLLAGLESEGDGLAATGLSDDELRELIWLSQVDFPEYREDAADAVPFATCPQCGHEFPVPANRVRTGAEVLAEPPA